MNDAEFLEIDGYFVLLPITRKQNSNVTIMRTILSADSNMLTIFLKVLPTVTVCFKLST